MSISKETTMYLGMRGLSISIVAWFGILVTPLAILAINTRAKNTVMDIPPVATESQADSAAQAPQDASKLASAPQSLPSSNDVFRRQFGLGGTLLPAEILWNLQSGTAFYQGGIQVSLYGRVHPYVTILGSIGVTGNFTGVFFGGVYGELATNLGARFYVRKMNAATFSHRFFLAPYAVANFLLNVAGFNPNPLPKTPTTVYLGAQLGAGVEFRLNEKMLIDTDIRLIARGATNAATSLPQVGFQFAGGFSYYF